MSFVKLFSLYLKEKIAIILIILLFGFIFGLLNFLYGLPISGAVYGVLLCACLCALAFVPDFLHFCKKLRILQQSEGFIKAGTNNLPAADTTSEALYQALLCKFDDAFRELVTENRYSYDEMQDFYAQWVHQIKTPISAMSLIIQENDSMPQKTALAQELFKIERYTEAVLNYLRLSETTVDLLFQTYALDDMVKQAVKKYAPIFIGKNIAVKLTNLSCKVITDDKWFVMALEQLISNALKYTQSGRVDIYAEEGPVLVIKDTGTGINAEDLPRIFEKGFTGYNGRMDKKATGIGLYLAKKALDKLGHKIEIISKENKGTAVRIDLSCQYSVYE